MGFAEWHVVFLILSVVIGLISLGISLFAVYSPAWQVVLLREFTAEHQHGLFQDCVREMKHVTAALDLYNEAPLSCMFKFDSSAQQAIIDGMTDADAAAVERERHLFSGWHKLLLMMFVTADFLVLIGACCALCVLRYQAMLYFYGVLVFVAMLLSLIGDGIFVVEAMRVDVRFAQGAVGTYEQQIGYAFYVHLFGTVLLVLAVGLIVATICTYRRRVTGNSSNYGPEIPGPPLLEKYTSPSRPSAQGPYTREYAYHVTSA